MIGRSSLFSIVLIVLFLPPLPAQAAYDQEVVGIASDIADSVPEGQRAVIVEGITLAERYFTQVMGIRLSPQQKRRWRIKVVATGKGNTERGGGGSCCTAFSASHTAGPRLFFDVRHQHWTKAHRVYKRTNNKSLKTIVHEYVHGIQMVFGTRNFNGGKMPNWMVEGMAEYFAYEAMFWSKKLSRRSIDQFMASGAKYSDEFSMPLERFVPDGGHPWSGHVGYVAILGLVKESGQGPQSLISYMNYLNKGQSHSRAFQTAFGLSETEFYSRFESYRQENKNRSQPNPYWNR